MRTFHLLRFLCLGLCLLAPMDSRALVFWNLDNSANQSDPGTGVPWDSVARVAGTDLSLTSTTGSAIYLGNGFMLTANHVTLGINQRITFDGVTPFKVDFTFNGGAGSKQVAPGVDLKVFKLTALPVATAVTLGTSNELNSTAVLIGYGVGRGATALGTSPVAWGDTTTVAKRWGRNVPRTSTTLGYDTYSYTAVVSVAGSASADPAGLGDNEAALTLMDSGSAMFQFIAGNWVLVGVGTNVEQQAGANTTTFGRDATSGGSRGDANYHASVVEYRDEINAAIPEPGTAALWLLALAMLAMPRRKP